MIDSRRAEFFILAGLIFFLPLYEAPKNILYALFVVIWIYNRVREGNFGGRPTYWDGLIAAWFVSALLAAIFAGLPAKEWRGLNDVAHYTLLLWMISRTRFHQRQLITLFVVLAVSMVVGLGQAYWIQQIAQRNIFLELHSVGAVNHTAVYIAICYGTAAAVVTAYWTRWSPIARVSGALYTLLLLLGVFGTASRAAVGVALALTAALGLAWWPKSRKAAFIMLSVPFVAGALTFFFQPQVLLKQESNMQRDVTYAYRAEIWRTAMTEVREHPWFGVGPDNYSQISPERVAPLVRARGEDYDPKRFYFTSHAHSMYMTTLAERGIVGLAVLLIVLLSFAVALLKYKPSSNDSSLVWALWGSAASAWFTICGVGVVNTTLHDEIALLAALLLGLWLSSRRTIA